MSLSESGRPSYRWLIVTLCAAVGVYTWYALGQYRRLNDLHQRQLSSATAELKASLETARVTVLEFNKKWVAQTQKANKPTLCEFDRTQPYLDLDTCETPWSQNLIVQPVTSPTLGIDAIPTAASKQPRQGTDTIHFRFRTDVVLKELAFPDAFELIFVATDAGVVLYEESPAQRRWLRYLRWGEQAFRDSGADGSPTLQVQNLQQMVGGADAWNRLRSVSSQTSLQLGGVPHHVFLQPLSIDSSGERKDLIVGGAVPTSAMIRDSLTLDAGVVGVLAFLLLLCVLGFPFIKLLFLDPHERLRLRDINLLYLSSGALLVLFTCASLAWDGHVRWRALANRGIQTLARELKSGFQREVAAIRDQLSDYDAQVGRWGPIDCEREPVQTRWFATTLAPSPGIRTLPRPTRPIQLRIAAWIRPDDGRQIWKATSDSIQGRTAVDKRFYFRAVRDGHLFQMPLPDKGTPFFFGTDRSIVNGKFYAFLSMESSSLKPSSTYCVGATFDRPAIASATAQLLSLDQQPLPAGYGFALVNREGRTLFHSDSRLSLRENFFEELSEGARVRAMMYANKSGPLTSRYRERTHELYLEALDLQALDLEARDPSRVKGHGPAGFYLVAFRDTSIERAVVGRVLVEGLSGPVLLLFGIFAAGLFALSLGSRLVARRWSAWLWPHGGLKDVYKWQAIWLAVLLLVSLAIYPIIGSAVFLLTPLLASMIGLGVYRIVGRHQHPRCRLTATGWHAAAIALVLICIVVVPSAALFRLALGHEFAKLISTERAWMAAQKVDAIAAAEVEAREEGYALSDAPKRKAARQAYVVSVPAPFDVGLPVIEARSAERAERRSAPAGVKPTGMDAIALTALQGWLDTLLPSDDAVWSRQQAQTPDFTYSPDGTLLASLRASGGAAMGLALTLGLLVWWIRWNTDRLFFADEESSVDAPPVSVPFEELWQTRTPDEQLVLLQVARERIANPYQRAVIQKLLRDGLLRLNPDLQPCSEEFEQFLQGKERELQGEILTWEQVNVGHSWRYVRLALAAGVTCLGFFLLVTQPALQSSLVGIATGITGVLTTGLKARDAVASWLSQRKGSTGIAS